MPKRHSRNDVRLLSLSLSLSLTSHMLSHVQYLWAMDCSPQGSSVHGILQARILEWVAISYSRDLPNTGIKPTSPECSALSRRFFTTEPSGKPLSLTDDDVKLLSHVQLFAIPWTVAYQAPPSLEFSRQEYWNGLPFPSHLLVLDKSSSVQSLSHVQLFATHWNAEGQASLSYHQLPEFTQTRVHWVSDAIQPSHPLSSPSPPAFNLFQHQCLFFLIPFFYWSIVDLQCQHQCLFKWVTSSPVLTPAFTLLTHWPWLRAQVLG